MNDRCAVVSGFADDCNDNLVPDSCEVGQPGSEDCNGNRVPDVCDLASGTSLDVIEDGIPDECGSDCNGNGISDTQEIAGGARDCNDDGLLDECNILPALNLVPVALPPPPTSPPQGQRAGAIARADIDGDGDDDLAVALPFSVETYRNLGDRRFEHVQTIPVRAGPVGLVGADFDGDGAVDLATVNALSALPFGSISFLRNNGTGDFTLGFNAGVGNDPSKIIAPDLDGDGKADLAILNRRSAEVTFFLQRDNGLERVDGLPVSSRATDFASADFDGDGDVDLVVADDRMMQIFDNRGGAVFEFTVEIKVNAAESLEAGDVDDDGLADIVAWEGGVLVLQLNVDRGGSWRRVSSALSQRGAIELADLDGDGDNEIVVSTPSSLNVVFNFWKGSFGGFLAFGRGPLAAFSESLTTADYDRDGRPDVATVTARGGPNVFFSSTAPVGADCNENGVPDVCDTGEGSSRDCNQNGIPDECDVRVGDCNANGVPDSCDLRSAISFRRRAEYPLDARYFRIGDLNGDGVDDFISVNSGDGGMTVFLGGSLDLREQPELFSEEKLLGLQLVDFDHDDDLDAVTIFLAPRDVVLLENDGDGGFEPRTLFELDALRARRSCAIGRRCRL